MKNEVEHKQSQTQTGKKKWLSGKSKKSIILGSIFFVALPIGAGIVAGSVISKFFIGKTANYEDVNVSEIQADVDTVMQKYQKCKDSGIDYSTSLKPYEMVNAAYELFAQEEHSIALTIGDAVASVVNQSIRACTIRDGNNYFEESLSKSNFVGVASRIYMDATGNEIKQYLGSATGSESAEYQPVYYPYSMEEYSDGYGKTPVDPLIYVVSKKTTINSMSKVNRDGTDYVIDLTLNPTNSVIKYVKQMKSTSNLGDFPAFTSLNLVFRCDENLLIKKLNVHEMYYAKTSAVGADIDANLEITYKVGDQFDIPSITEMVNYGGKQ